MEDNNSNETLLSILGISSVMNETEELTIGCLESWLEPNHVLFQVANSIVLVGFAFPSNVWGKLLLHAFLMIGFLLISTWSWTILCAPDIFTWNFCFTAANLIQVLYMLHQLKPIKFSPELEEVYSKLFQPLHVPRSVFRKLISRQYAKLSSLQQDETYAVQNVTKTDKLALLISGSLTVHCNQQFLHHIKPMEFFDSPEYDCSTTGDEKYQATIVAAESCSYILWSRVNLSYLFTKEAKLSQIMGMLISRDITNKLYTLNEKMITGRGCRQDIRLPTVVAFISGKVRKPRFASSELSGSSQLVTESASDGGSSCGLLMDHPVMTPSTTCTVVSPIGNGNIMHDSTSNHDLTHTWDSRMILV